MGHPERGASSGRFLALSSFVGRRRDVAEARRLLSISRLVTLTGPGGVGKTRLALEVANTVSRSFSDGTVLVELDQVSDPALVVHTVAASLGLREQAGRAPLEMLIDYLASRRLLLVLDNSEHVIDATAALADALLQACSDLQILATSREWLGIEGEVVMPVSPLALPDPAQPDDRNLLEYGAVELFVDRATSVVSDYGLTEGNRRDVAEICRRLDGLPLAIELAAARLRAFSEKEVLARLSDHPHLLSSPLRQAPARQRTLRSCIEWSHGLCSPLEKLLWARLSVFAGGFELDTAEAVCSGDGLDVVTVSELLANLLDKSILTGERHPDGVRYRMLDTIREFGREQLGQSEERARLQRRHRDAYLRMVEQADAEWVSARQVAWFARLDREHTNIQAALDFSLTRPAEVDAALRILTALFHFYWWGRGWAREGRLWFSRALDQPGPPSAVRARALLTDGSLALADGDFAGGRQRLAAAREILATVADPASAACAHWVEGSVRLYSGDLPAATKEFEAGLALLEPGRDLTVRLDLLLSLSFAPALLGDVERSAWCHEETMRITEPEGECFHRSYALWTIGLSVLQRGDLPGAVALIQQSIDLRRGIRDLTGLGWSEETLAWAEHALGHHERAVMLLGIADSLWEVMGRPLLTYQHMYPHHEACVQGARAQLGDQRFEAAFRRGRALSVDQGVAYALGELTSHAAAASSEQDTVLTAREREVAELIGEGLSNRQIAARLTISVRTAETHAQRILTKLGFRSRAQIAAWVAQQHATDRTASPTGSPR
ncbi:MULTISPECIES: ATP-binding protein [Nocardioides]|uniref:ATP-binding protein n=1 Tax=Nocardioides vastitatis TaxID=2568655 RepID=A0ABW0ZL03_9ACTN|nr:LuxR C-terminal-related transcriptional regulator [Nocardioides sp.]THJ11545.1 LuxR family transcriptional regulator [Nocardioides sp.]